MIQIGELLSTPQGQMIRPTRARCKVTSQPEPGVSWPADHVYRVNNRETGLDSAPTDLASLSKLRSQIEPWITSLVGSEHLAILAGSGLSTAVAGVLGVTSLDMNLVSFAAPHSDKVDARAAAIADAADRGSPNVEDQLRAALELRDGLRVLDDPAMQQWDEALEEVLGSFARRVLAVEASLVGAVEARTDVGLRATDALASFFGSFGARSATRDRLHVFTTNYDRIVEFALDEMSIWQLDRFVGTVSPRFRASRLDLDIHYSPPGIRGEPRYLEGVNRLTKLHGSIDWVAKASGVVRVPMPFGCSEDVFAALIENQDALIIYPNPAKDVETSEYPYAELFRDFSAAIVRPETVLVTYGYGFGDDHINRVIADMLTIPSTHLLAIAYSDPGLRLRRFLTRTGRASQISILLGDHFGDLENLVQWYLPKPSVDRVSQREAELLQRRGLLPPVESADHSPVIPEHVGGQPGEATVEPS